MNKKILIPMMAILLIGVVMAGTVTLSHVFDVKDVNDFTKVTAEKVSNQQTLKLTINGEVVEVNGTEADNRWDANGIESLVSKYAINGTVTKVELVGTGTWKENAYGKKSFNEAELKADECSHEGSTYDSKLNDCVEITEDVVEETSVDTKV